MTYGLIVCQQIVFFLKRFREKGLLFDYSVNVISA
jgi:hypothetical protein